MTHASLFSGIGGPEIAAAMMGWENVFHCEINPFGRAVLEYWFPESDSYEDITKTDFTKYRGKIDILTGGFPCQPFSYAGKRGGQTDDRYLWPEMLRVIDEVRPTWVVGENVAGITTMVESCNITEMGAQSSLFDEGNGVHRYSAEFTFTIERVCKDLESKGYSVQPVLIPACAVGAPHRRDRVFIIAYNTDRSDDVRESGKHESKSREERISERNPIRQPRKSGDVRSKVQGPFTDTDCNGRSQMDQYLQCLFADGAEPECDGGIGNVADAYSTRLQKSFSAREPENTEENKSRLDYRTERFSCDGNASDAISERLEGEDESRHSERGKWMHLWRDAAGCCGQAYLAPEERWKGFPTVSAVHRGNDGLPFDVDDLTIPFAKWRTESLKAFGNAIVPQVMYRIFQCIQIVNDDR